MVNSRRNLYSKKVQVQKNPYPSWDLNPQPSVVTEGRAHISSGTLIFSKCTFLPEFRINIMLLLFLLEVFLKTKLPLICQVWVML